MKKIICKSCNILSSIILVLVVAVVVVLLVPRAFGYNILAVLSGSMEPTYHVGSVIYIDKNVEADQVEAGDAIAFYKEANVVATHRALEVDKENKQFITKGDANESKDLEPIPFANLIGKAVFTIPLIGYVSIYMKTAKGIIIVCVTLAVVILLYAIPEVLKPEEEKEKKRKVRKDVEEK